MTELELCKHRYDIMRKMAIECQQTIHFMSNISNRERHKGEMDTCTEQSCILFRKALEDVDKFEESYYRSFPDLKDKPSKDFRG